MNINDLINDLTKEREALKNGEIEPKVASELNNNAGKIIHAAKLSFEYETLTKDGKDVYVKFLSSDQES